MCVPHTNVSAERPQIQEATTDWFCRQSAGRSARHFPINDLVWRALTKADTPCTNEPPGLIGTDGKRPVGATLVPWARGKYIAWDFTAIQMCAAPYLHLSPSVPGGAAEHAADRKRNKYATVPASREFVPIVVEILGPINGEGREFLLELGRRGAGLSGDPRETVFLFQRLSVCIQRFNAVVYRGTFSTHSPDEKVLT